jgi:peptidoglycan/LPS O-acetylase OafA/YrhL
MTVPTVTAVSGSPAADESPRLRVLDAFRALAILAVMLHHYLSRYAPPDQSPSLYGYRHSYPHWLDLGTLGVQFFFIISGFVIFMTLQRCRHLFEFWIRRLARLYPAYVVATLVTFCIVNLIGPVELHSRPTDIAAGLAFLTPYFAGTRFVDGSYWSLVVEMQFYFVIGILYTHFRSRFELVWALYGFAAAAAWSLGASEGLHLLRTLSRHLLLAESVPYFTAGIVFYKLYSGERRGWWLLALSAVAAYVAVEPEFANPPDLAAWRPVVTLAMLVLFTLFVLRRLEWLAVRPLVFLGGISYSFYLLHQFIGVSLIPIFTRRLHLPDLAACTAAALFTGTLSFALTRLVEIPSKAAVLGWARRRILPLLPLQFPGFSFRPAARTPHHLPGPATAANAIGAGTGKGGTS